MKLAKNVYDDLWNTVSGSFFWIKTVEKFSLCLPILVGSKFQQKIKKMSKLNFYAQRHVNDLALWFKCEWLHKTKI